MPAVASASTVDFLGSGKAEVGAGVSVGALPGGGEWRGLQHLGRAVDAPLYHGQDQILPTETPEVTLPTPEPASLFLGGQSTFRTTAPAT